VIWAVKASSFKYNQQYATFVPGLLLLSLAWLGWNYLQPNHASGSSKQAWHVPDAVYTVLELLMMCVETARNMYSIDNNKEYCITLHLVGCTYKNTLTMQVT
jgi:hypothetical protein